MLLPNCAVLPKISLDKWGRSGYNNACPSRGNPHGGIAQLVEHSVHTRSVICSSQIAATIRPVGQAVKTPPFHGGNMGSIPVRVTKNRQASACRFCCIARRPDVGAHCICAREGTIVRRKPCRNRGCHGRIFNPPLQVRCVGVDVPIDPCRVSGHKARPYRHAPGFLVGAGFIPARAQARRLHRVFIDKEALPCISPWPTSFGPPA